MKTFLLVIGSFVLLVVTWIVWRIASVARGAKRRDERILKELGPIQSGVDAARLAEKPHLRKTLHALLEGRGQASLFPQEHLGRLSQAEAVLAYWMMHPNELQDPPAQMEHVATLTREVDGRIGEFEVFRYRMPEGHWAGTEWILGLAGPFFPNEKPYAGFAAGWSIASDTQARATPESVVDHYISLVRSRGGFPAHSEQEPPVA